ncbi:ABC transporter ATP-binding protein [Caldicellulosiruptor naganoensis]|uniref:ABC transporter ATP-binding protein n=1 Tax=Caldicellulosiruptor naganoensis TaxID=29324 RepID=A0ABY7BG38_9FIRM|nr:ABC transporter ATP-binding protein [Caldicellulosiruptor naganoensis]WAM31793.1 ABC transporter ATP-binding protein [Caldicellulosiruptor naganoensis]
MLEIIDLHVEVGSKEILKGVSLTIPDGETHILFGPNGSGKTTLMMSIMGLPKYKITSGKIIFNGIDITYMPTHERAKLGIGMMFQKPPAIRGVELKKLSEIIKSIRNTDADIQEYARILNLKEHLSREVNYGFSGGEIKRSELLQLLCQKPSLVLLDEPESGVDLDNITLLGNVIKKLLKGEKIKKRHTSGLIVTHTGYILEYVNADKGHILMDGKIVCSGSAEDLFEEIRQNGFGRCENCLQDTI